MRRWKQSTEAAPVVNVSMAGLPGSAVLAFSASPPPRVP